MITVGKHVIHLVGKGRSVTVRCDHCPEWKPSRARYGNSAGHSYAMAGAMEVAVSHLLKAGVISTEDVSVQWSARPVLRVRMEGRFIGYATSDGYVRGGWYFRAARYGICSAGVLALIHHVQGNRQYCYEAPRRVRAEKEKQS